MKMAWIYNGWRLAREVREIRRGKNKGKFEIKYKKGYKLKKTIISADAIREGQINGI